MGFGLSGDDSQTLMFGADPTITWVDTMTGEANAVDYHLSAYRQVNYICFSTCTVLCIWLPILILFTV